MTAITITTEKLVTADKNKDVRIIKFAGQLDESNVDENAKTIYKIVQDGGDGLSLIFDFAKLEYMNSKAIGYLTDWYGKVTAKKGKIVIAQAKSNIMDILQVVGLTQLIDAFATIDEAKLALDKK